LLAAGCWLLAAGWSLAPCALIGRYADLFLERHLWSTEQELAGLQGSGSTLEQIRAFHNAFLHDYPVRIKMLVNGNATASDAGECFARVASLFGESPTLAAAPEFANTLIPRGVRYNHESKHSNAADVNSAYFLLMQLPPHLTLEDEALLALLGQMIREPIFTQLRTKDKIGYVVTGGSDRPWAASPTAQVVVRLLSKTHTPAAMRDQVHAFLNSKFIDDFTSMEAEVFHKSVRSLRSKLLEPPRKLADVTAALWTEIASGRLQWGRKRDLAGALERCAATPDRLYAMLRALLSGAEARHLAISIHSDELWAQRQPGSRGSQAEAGLDGVTAVEVDPGESGILKLRASLPTVIGASKL